LRVQDGAGAVKRELRQNQSGCALSGSQRSHGGAGIAPAVCARFPCSSIQLLGEKITLCGKCIEVCPHTRRYLDEGQ